MVHYFGNHRFYARTVDIAFFFNLFAVGQNSFYFAQVHDDVPVGEAAHGTRYDFAFAGFKFLVKVIAFNAAHFLNEHLFGNLRRNTGEIFHFQCNGYYIARFGVFEVFFGGFHINFHFRVADDFHHI